MEMNTQNERKKKLKINWLEECPKCKRNHVEVTTIKGSKELLFDGDKVNCWCGQTGEIETNNGEAWVEWDEVVISDKDNHDTYYRSKYPDFWDRLPACNHQAWEHYEVSLHAWLVALKQNKEKLEGCVVVQPQGLVLTCAELLEALEFGAPDLKIERTEYSEEQMSTEIAIVHRDTGYGGSGLYAYCVECQEEGSIKLGGNDE